MPVGHRQHQHLHRRQPGREGPGVVLDEDAEEPLHRPEQRPVDHDRAVAGVVRARVLEAEELRQLEVDLDGGQLPRAADGVARLHRDLGPVERAATLVEHQVQVLLLRGLPEALGRLGPVLVRADRLILRLRRQLQVELAQPVVAQERQHEPQQRLQLLRHLLAAAEDVRIVLRHAAHPRETVHDP